MSEKKAGRKGGRVQDVWEEGRQKRRHRARCLRRRQTVKEAECKMSETEGRQWRRQYSYISYPRLAYSVYCIPIFSPSLSLVQMWQLSWEEEGGVTSELASRVLSTTLSASVLLYNCLPCIYVQYLSVICPVYTVHCTVLDETIFQQRKQYGIATKSIIT